MKIAVCNKCGQTYSDEESIKFVEKWLAKDNYAPCPKMQCDGQMEVKDTNGPDKKELA